jgi:acetolactate decarboxylase
VVWRIPSDGRPVLAPGSLGLPFAVAASGGRAITADLPPGMVFEAITNTLDGISDLLRAESTMVAALRIDGTFTDVLLRSEPRQDPPYQLLSHVLEHEVRFAFDRWQGTLVGFRFSDERDGTAIPGLHLHGVANDRTSGGHCHHATIEKATLTAWIDDVQFVVP